ncbi:MAG: sugar phosphate nucleotidyltransferase [Puniceicoccaceae bacterium]
MSRGPERAPPAVRTAFLPSAGLGKRLRPLTEHLPKPLLPVDGEPMIVHAMRHCRDAGVERFIVNTHYLAEAFEVAFPEHEWEGLPIEFVHESVRLETGGGLKNIELLLDPGAPLVVYNSDILTDFPLAPFFEEHFAMGRPYVTLAASRKGPDLHLVADERARLRGVDRRRRAGSGERFQFLGVAVVEPAFLRFLGAGVVESVVHGWSRAIAEDPDSIRLHEVEAGRWTDVGTLAAYETARRNGLDTACLRMGP